DLAVATGAHYGLGEEPNKIFMNIDGRLLNVADDLGLAEPLIRGRQFLFLDVNGDDILDAFIAARRRAMPRLGHSIYLQRREGAQIQFVRAPSAWNLVDDDGEYAQLTWLPPVGLALFVHGWPCRLYAIRKEGLVDITKKVGLSDLNTTGDSAWADFDGDGDLDLFVGGWVHDPDVVIDEHGNVRGELISSNRQSCEAQLAATRSKDSLLLEVWGLKPAEIRIGSAGVVAKSKQLELTPDEAIGFPEATDERSLRVGFDQSTNRWRIALSSSSWSRAGFTASCDSGLVSADLDGQQPKPFKRSRLFSWEGDRYVERSARLHMPLQPVRSVAAADFDCDGDVDLYLVCSTDVRNFPNVLLQNDGTGRFTVQEGGAGATGTREGSGDSVAVLDYDNDGGPDLVLTNGQGDPPFSDDGPDQLFRNDGPRGNWLEIDLVAKGTNRDAIGARVIVHAGTRRLLRLQDGGAHCRAQNHRRLHFGLGEVSKIDRVDVSWPNGEVTEISDVGLNRVLRIEQR
ncbi:MAG: CRTAC1 family protein, partial [Planctomycetaceae bacterium]|nr:CRTAC1 family protein [Planctomycetaceae bacterium]